MNHFMQHSSGEKVCQDVARFHRLQGTQAEGESGPAMELETTMKDEFERQSATLDKKSFWSGGMDTKDYTMSKGC
jgi:hypothetical protein